MNSYNRALEITGCESSCDNIAHEETFVGWVTHLNERRVAVKTNHVWNSRGCKVERTGWEGKRVDRLRTERHPGVFHSGGVEGDGL